jgi:hypothetical protein
VITPEGCHSSPAVVSLSPFRSGLLVISMLLSVLGPAGVRAHNGAMAGSGRKEKPYALIFGTVWGPDNRPLYGVKVKIRRSDQKKARWEQYSDHHGEFAQRVPPGKADYVLWPDLKNCKMADGSKLHRGTPVTVHIENDERVDTGLHLNK